MRGRWIILPSVLCGIPDFNELANKTFAKWRAEVLTCISHGMVGRIEQTMWLPELRPQFDGDKRFTMIVLQFEFVLLRQRVVASVRPTVRKAG